jgi:hypothetical protein
MWSTRRVSTLVSQLLFEKNLPAGPFITALNREPGRKRHSAQNTDRLSRLPKWPAVETLPAISHWGRHQHHSGGSFVCASSTVTASMGNNRLTPTLTRKQGKEDWRYANKKPAGREPTDN